MSTFKNCSLKNGLSVCLLFCLCLLFGTQVFGQNPLSPAGKFNVFLKGDATFITNESEGPIAIGGNLTVAGNYQVSFISTGNFQVGGVPIGLLVNGSVNYQSGVLQVNQGGYVKIGNCNGSTVWYQDPNGATPPIRITPFNNSNSYNNPPYIQINTSATGFPGGTVSPSNNPVCQGSLIDFNDAFSTLSNNSNGLAGCQKNVNVTNANGDPSSFSGDVYINDNGLGSGPRILNITGSELNSISGLTSKFTPSANNPLIINVSTGASFNWDVKPNNTGGAMQYIIWNFPNVTDLTISGSNTVDGSVLAPNANVIKTNPANIQGQLIAQSYNQNGGEMHHYPFGGNVTPCGTVCVKPTPTVNSATICDGESATLTVSNCNSSVSWSNGSTSNSITVNPSSTTDYTVTCGTGNCTGQAFVQRGGGSTAVAQSPAPTGRTSYNCGFAKLSLPDAQKASIVSTSQSRRLVTCNPNRPP